jgi:WD40 repeat protein
MAVDSGPWVFTITTHFEARSAMQQHLSPISGVACHGGRYIATAGYDNQVILWDAKGNTPIAVGRHEHLANQCMFSPDGRFLVSTSSDYTANVWTVPGLALQAKLVGHTDDVESAAFSPDGTRIATCSRDYSIGLWNREGKRLLTILGHTKDVISVGWISDLQNPGELTLISSSDDGTVKLWSATTGKLLRDIDLGAVETDTLVVASPTQLYAGNDKGEIINLADGSITQAHDAGIKRLIFDAREHRLVSLSYDRTARFWKIATNGGLSLVQVATFPAIVWPRAAASLDADTMVFATFGSSYALYHLHDNSWHTGHIQPTQGINGISVSGSDVLTIGDAGITKCNGTTIGVPGSLCNFVIRPYQQILCGGQMGQVLDGTTGEIIYQHRSPLNCAAHLKTATMDDVLIGTYTGEVLRLSFDGRKYIFKGSFTAHENAVKGISTDGTLIFTVCADATASFFTVMGDPLKTYVKAHARIINGCASIGGGQFVSVGRDRTLRVFSVNQNEATYTVPCNHSVKCVATQSGGSLVACGSYRGEFLIFDRSSKAWVYSKQITPHGISSIAYHAGKNAFLAASYDGRIYEVAIDSALRETRA